MKGEYFIGGLIATLMIVILFLYRKRMKNAADCIIQSNNVDYKQELIDLGSSVGDIKIIPRTEEEEGIKEEVIKEEVIKAEVINLEDIIINKLPVDEFTEALYSNYSYSAGNDIDNGAKEFISQIIQSGST